MGRPAQAMPPRTLDQNRRMWGVVAELRRLSGLAADDAEEVLRRCCREASGQEHTSQLTQVQAEVVIGKMDREISGYSKPAESVERKPERKPWGERGPGPRGGQAITPKQQAVLQALFEQAGLDTRERQMGFCKRQFGVPWPQTQANADALYEPLKAMILRRVKPSELQARTHALVGNGGLDAWKANFIADLDRQFSDAAKTGKMKTVITTHKLLKLIECELAVSEEGT